MQGGDGDDTLNGVDGAVEDDMSGDDGDDLCAADDNDDVDDCEA